MTDGHDIPEWFIPSGEHVIANEHERDAIEEDGELDEPLCPHCGEPYEKQDGDDYIHAWRPVEGGPDVEPDVWCVSTGAKRRYDRELLGYGEW